MEREKLLEQKRQAEEYLARIPQEFGEHMRSKHNGFFASSCHKCFTFKGGIRSNQWFLRDFERGVFDSK